jgi:TRAP transporter TAXI family solute receptor
MIRLRQSLFVALALLVAVASGAIVSGSAAAQSVLAQRDQINRSTVGIISGGVNGTYIRIAADLAAVLDKGEELRVLPVVGKGSVQNISDLLYLRGIDVAIVQSDVLSYIRDQKIHNNIEQRLRYITKLYNEEIHLLARNDILSINDLAGKKVNFDNTGSGTYMTASTVFRTLGIAVEPQTFDQALALEKLTSGEISAMVYVAGKPTELFRRIGDNSALRLVPIEPTAELLATYLPSSFDHRDYPHLIAEGQTLPTLAVGAVMAAYNWKPDSERYQRVAAFVRAFFDNFEEFRKPPRHAKWQEVNLAATLPGWTRFPPAEAWLTERVHAGQKAASSSDPALRQSFEQFLAFMQQSGQLPRNRSITEAERAALFSRFLEWQRSNPR